MAGNYEHQLRAAGSLLTAVIYNTDHINHIQFHTPAGLDDASPNISAMRQATSPGLRDAESLPISTEGELHRLRYVIARLAGTLYWTDAPQVAVGAYNHEWFL